MFPNSHLLERNRQSFFACIRATYPLPQDVLLSIVRNQALNRRYRAAALRILVCRAPANVTHSQPYAAARRLVRQHYCI